MKAFFLLAFLFFATVALSQDISTAKIQWTSTETFEPATGVRTEETTTLTLTGRSKIEWKDANGVSRRTFNVVEIFNEWSSLQTGETMEIQISDDIDIGSISITKTTSGVKGIITLARDEPVSYELKIVSSN